MSNRDVYLGNVTITENYRGIEYSSRLGTKSHTFKEEACSNCYTKTLCCELEKGWEIMGGDSYGDIVTRVYLCAECLEDMSNQIVKMAKIRDEFSAVHDTVEIGDEFVVCDGEIYVVTGKEELGVLLKCKSKNKAFFVSFDELDREYKKQ